MKRFHYLLFAVLTVIIFMIPVYNKIQWNEKGISLGSDPQIKYYQANSFYHNGFTKETLECYYPAHKLGFPVNNIPIGYPWAFLAETGKCYFQYPVFMPIIHALIAKLTGFDVVIFFPIVFFIFNFLLVFGIFRLLGYDSLKAGYLSLFTHFLSPVFLSSLDYSEVTFNNFFFLLAIFMYEKIRSNSNQSSIVYIFLSGLFISMTFQLRPESTIAIIIFLSLGFLNHLKSFSMVKKYLGIGLLFLLITGLFSYFNYSIYQHVFGMKGLNTLQDTQVLNLNQYAQNWVADLWGSEFKIGIFRGYPILLSSLLLIFFYQKMGVYGQYFFSGLCFILILPILSPYRAGVDILGLRYYESGVYLLLIGSLGLVFDREKTFVLKHKLIIAVCLLSGLSYFSYKSNLRGIKQWSGASKVSNLFTKAVFQISPDLIVHRGLSTTYLMGVSYLNIPQIVIYSQEDWPKVEKISKTQNLKKILYLYWEGNKLVDAEFPRAIWRNYFDINFELNVSNDWHVKSLDLIHFKGLLLQSK